MRILPIQFLILVAGCIVALPAVAGVGATNSGVTTTLPNQDPTQPSADVQAQSSGFVQQNQQLQNQQNRQNPATQGPSGIVLPGGVAHNGNQPGAAAGSNAANPEKSSAASAPATPPPPPPPPPVYQSIIKPVVRDTPSSDEAAMGQSIASTAAPEPAVRRPDKPVPTTPPPAQATPPAPVAQPAKALPQHSADATPEAEAQPPANVGGRGDAPDGFTFVLGLLVAGTLLAFALVTYLRIGRSGSNNSET